MVWNATTPGGPSAGRLLLWSVAGWTIFGLIAFGQDVSIRLLVQDPRPWQEWVYWTVRVLISAALTPFILWAGTRWPLERHTWARNLAPHLMMSLCFAALRTAIEASIFLPLRAAHYMADAPPWVQSFGDAVKTLVIFGIPGALIAYWIVLSIQATFRHYEKLQERELHAAELHAEVARARLETLKLQLQPHFLFNTLNGIATLVREQRATQAEEAIGHLSDLLRAVLDDMDAHEVTLARELEHLRLYLAIQQMRFSDRLQAQIDVEADALDAAVPHMGIQPLVENAIRHGIGKRAASGSLRVEARRVDEQLHILVSDNGPGFSPQKTGASRGRGLSNIRARLQQLYGAAAELRFLPADRQMTTVAMILPFRRHRAVGHGKPTEGGLGHAGRAEYERD
jgi:two-component system, LytTR family, sensor kinase